MTYFGYNVNICSKCDYSECSEEEFGDWSELYSNSFKSITKTDKYPDVTSLHDFKSGDVAYLVWVEYSTGDSFGSGHRNGTEVIALLKNGADATALEKAIFISGDKFSWTSSEGQVIEYGFAPWRGYFENLEDVHIETVTF